MENKNYIKDGVAHGKLANALMNENGNSIAKYRPVQSSINAAALPARIWETIDQTILRVAKQELVGIADLNRAPGIAMNFDGMTASVYTLWRASKMSPAHTAMSPDTRGEADILDFDSTSVPLPVTVKDFWLNTKQTSTANANGISLAQYATEEATFQVSNLLEETLFNGNFVAAGSTVYGYTTFPARQTYTITDWTTAAPEDIFHEVNAMVHASMDANHFGPWILYIPWEYSLRLNEDYTTGAVPTPLAQTIQQRLLQINNLSAIRVSKHLATNNVVLVEMSQRTVRLINGIPMTAIDWEPPGSPNWNHNYKVIAMSVPLLISDYEGQCGIVHGTTA